MYTADPNYFCDVITMLKYMLHALGPEVTIDRLIASIIIYIKDLDRLQLINYNDFDHVRNFANELSNGGGLRNGSENFDVASQQRQR